MTKDELIARLRSLGEQLNRDVSLTGTKEELALRVAELEEELDDTDETAGQDTPLSRENVLTGHENEVGSAQPDTVILDTSELVTVVALVKLHTDALHATRDEPVAFVLPGTAFRVSAGVAAEMTERGLAVLIHLKYEKTGRTLDYSGSDGIRFGGACKPVAQILVVNQ